MTEPTVTVPVSVWHEATDALCAALEVLLRYSPDPPEAVYERMREDALAAFQDHPLTVGDVWQLNAWLDELDPDLIHDHMESSDE